MTPLPPWIISLSLESLPPPPSAASLGAMGAMRASLLSAAPVPVTWITPPLLWEKYEVNQEVDVQFQFNNVLSLHTLG